MHSYALGRPAADRFRSRWSLALGLLLSAALSLAALLAGPPADAEAPGNTCPEGSFCVWPETGFGGQPQVVNGASELMGSVFGPAGEHARSAIGVAALPLGAPVEVEVVVDLA